jgi:uncharacterized protein YjbI with pentapeptide repeats
LWRFDKVWCFDKVPVMGDDASARIKRIDEISSPARTAWFTLLGVLAFVAVTLLSITHADILVDSRMIALPVVGVSVPTNLFLLLTPVVLAVLYANLHLYLLKLWQAFRRAPTDAELGEGRSLADHVQPWLVNDYALTLKNGTVPGDHHRTLLRNVITLFTVWWAPLGVLAWMWYVALLTRDLRVILVILGCIVVSALVGLHSWLRAHRWLQARRRRMLTPVTNAALAGLAAFGLVASWDATRPTQQDSLLGRLPGLPHQLRLDREDLVGGNVQAASIQRADFRRTWCALADLPSRLCGTVPAATPYETNRVILDRRAYCRRELGIDGARLVQRCDGYFLDLDAKFDAAWAEARREKLAALPRLDLSRRNLAGASAEDVNLAAARMEFVDLSGARLPRGRLEGAALKGADLSGATAFYADLAYADLTWATLDRANLESARLQGASLRGARLQGANLNHANLVAADLTNADLRGARLRFARLHRADLSGALIAGADLTEATGLTQGQLDSAIGDASTRLTEPRVVLPRPLVIVPSDRPVLRPFHVSTCWPEAPGNLSVLLKRPDLDAAYRAELEALAARVCPPSKDETVFGAADPPADDAPVVQTGLGP